MNEYYKQFPNLSFDPGRIAGILSKTDVSRREPLTDEEEWILQEWLKLSPEHGELLERTRNPWKAMLGEEKYNQITPEMWNDIYRVVVRTLRDKPARIPKEGFKKFLNRKSLKIIAFLLLTLGFSCNQKREMTTHWKYVGELQGEKLVDAAATGQIEEEKVLGRIWLEIAPGSAIILRFASGKELAIRAK